MRRQAGDAMFHTIKTMEQLYALFGWCGITGSCSDPVRIVVDQPVDFPDDTPPGVFFNPGPHHTKSPLDSVYVERVPVDPSFSWPDRAQSAALDVIAHEWGHGVDKYGSATFAKYCDNNEPEICQMSEGFSDVIGHVVEHRVHTNDGVAAPASNFVEHPEQRDWAAGEDWDPTNIAGVMRRADMYDGEHSCSNPLQNHYSVHADDEACEPMLPVTVAHSAGNRLSVVLKLLAEGGPHPACSLFGNCDLDVEGIGLDAAAKILFRVLVVEADTGTSDWDELPYLARGAVRDLFSVEECPAIQQSVFDAFEAVGYPEAVARPCVMCGPIQACPPCCPPPCCDEQQEE